MIYLRSIGLVG